MKRTISTIIGLLALLAGGLVAMTGTALAGGGGGQTHVFVCKYVGQPGVDETLKDGKQPIYVASDATVGTYFKDGQGRSYVLAVADETNTGQGKTYTGDLTCPAPEGPTVVTPGTPDVTPPTCTADGTLVLPDGPEGVRYVVDPAYDGPGEYTVTAVALKGFVLAPAEHDWSWDLTVAPQLTGDQCQTTPPPPVVTPGPANPQASIVTVCGHATFTLTNLTAQTTDESATFVTTINGKDSTQAVVKAGGTQVLEYGQTVDVGVVHLGVRSGEKVLASADLQTKCGQGALPPKSPPTTPVANTTPMLPHTGGGSALPIAAVGALLLLLGGGAIWLTRKV